MPQNKSIGWLKSVTLERALGVHHHTLDNRGVETRKIQGVRHWSLDDVVSQCGDIILKNLTPQSSGDDARCMIDLKKAATREKVRKLEIENDVKSGILIPSAEVDKRLGRTLKAIVDILDQIPTGVKMADPTVTQAQLETIKSTVNRIRNEAAAFRLEEE